LELELADVVIRAELLGKRYLIGHQAERERVMALRDAIVRGVRGFARSAAHMMRGRPLVSGDKVEVFWALKEVSFEVRRGDVVGIIGRNGAGKSTLLKILSRITEPSAGRVTIKGRVASLLEVGTGFHPELTGRENIYLNGAILGMTRAEIRRKFDEIVDFAEVERFLDTPVKRYSSGMYVRLAFAVAAHLEPEILLVDEVLAVGDAEFQRKCLGKMGEVASGGRTVLFVSHNIAAVHALCSRSLLLHNGEAICAGPTDEILARYLETDGIRPAADGDLKALSRTGAGNIRFRRMTIADRNGRPTSEPSTGEEISFVLEFEGSHTDPRPARLGLTLYDALDRPLFICANEASHKGPLLVGAGDTVACRIPRLPLVGGRYKIGLFLERNGVIEDWLQDCIPLDVVDRSFFGAVRNLPVGWQDKIVLVDHEWRRTSCSNDGGCANPELTRSSPATTVPAG
jgi:lipopolysaccharide transport system ATP-binding protein